MICERGQLPVRLRYTNTRGQGSWNVLIKYLRALRGEMILSLCARQVPLISRSQLRVPRSAFGVFRSAFIVPRRSAFPFVVLVAKQVRYPHPKQQRGPVCVALQLVCNVAPVGCGTVSTWQTSCPRYETLGAWLPPRSLRLCASMTSRIQRSEIRDPRSEFFVPRSSFRDPRFPSCSSCPSW